MRLRIVSLIAAIGALAAVSLMTESVQATNQLGKELDLACTSCHDKPGSKLLTDRGKYFELMRTMEGYDEIVDTFQECTACHVRKPGSERLTPRGRRLSRVIRDMEELRAWLVSAHPAGEGTEETADGKSDGDGSP